MVDKVDLWSRNVISEADELSSTEAVAKFVTRVWEHPLLDEQTRTHRNIAKTKLEKIITSYGIDASTFFTIPVGSLVWATDKDSDFDYILVFDSLENRKKAYDIFFAKNQQVNFNKRLGKAKVHILGRSGFLVGDNVPHDNYFDYLFTPDEYIGGSLDLIRKTRVGILKNMENHKWDQEKWEQNIGNHFDTTIRRWDDPTVKSAELFRGMTLKKDRTGRIADRLNRRAEQSQSPEKFKSSFKSARVGLTIPDYEIYRDALSLNSGEIHIWQKYVSQGISK